MLKNLFNKSSSSYSQETINILRLIRSDNVGPRTFHNLIKFYGTTENAINHLPELMAKSGKNKFKLYSEQSAIKEVEMMNKKGAKFIACNDPSYPSLLKTLPDYPPILSYKGNIELLSNKCAAIVGARNCSIAGKEIASKIAKELSQAQITVVSGLARGIDTAAHQASVPNTIAFIAGGIDNIYPPENHKLYERLSEEGLIIAELPIGSVPMAQHFPQRNRLISGLCNATIIIEASLKSGSLITARFALEQGREIFACPGYPLDPRCKGSNKLIKEGAILLESAEEIIEFYNNININIIMDHRNSHITSAPSYKLIDENLLSDQNKDFILSCLSSIPTSIEEIHQQTELPIAIITTILLELELNGKIGYQAGNKIVLNFENI